MPIDPTADDSDRVRTERLILAVVCIAQFMVIIDTTIVNVALSNMQADLQLSADGLTWVVNAYTLPFAGFLMFGGRAADFWGRRRLLMIGIGLFTSMSLLGGLAQNGTQLIATRAAQGLGAAALSPATLTILLTTFTAPGARARALGIWAAVAGAGGAAGVLAGGVLTDWLSWRSVLFINVPIGMVLVVLGRRVVTESRSRAAGSTLDWAGAVTVTGGLIALVYAVVAVDSHAWTSPLVLWCLALAAVLLAAFVAVEARHPHPLVPLRLFRSRKITGANLLLVLMFPANYTLLFCLSQYLQGINGYSAMRTGVAFLPMPIGFVTGSQVASRLVGRLGSRTLITIGALTTVTGLLWLSRLQAHDPYLLHIGLPGLLTTLGLSSTYVAATLVASDVDPADAGLASGLVNSTRTIGGSLGLAAMVSIAAARTSAMTGVDPVVAVTAGYTRAFAACAATTVVALVVALLVLPRHLAGRVPGVPRARPART